MRKRASKFTLLFIFEKCDFKSKVLYTSKVVKKLFFPIIDLSISIFQIIFSSKVGMKNSS